MRIGTRRRTVVTTTSRRSGMGRTSMIKPREKARLESIANEKLHLDVTKAIRKKRSLTEFAVMRLHIKSKSSTRRSIATISNIYKDMLGMKSFGDLMKVPAMSGYLIDGRDFNCQPLFRVSRSERIRRELDKSITESKRKRDMSCVSWLIQMGVPPFACVVDGELCYPSKTDIATLKAELLGQEAAHQVQIFAVTFMSLRFTDLVRRSLLETMHEDVAREVMGYCGWNYGGVVGIEGQLRQLLMASGRLFMEFVATTRNRDEVFCTDHHVFPINKLYLLAKVAASRSLLCHIYGVKVDERSKLNAPLFDLAVSMCQHQMWDHLRVLITGAGLRTTTSIPYCTRKKNLFVELLTAYVLAKYPRHDKELIELLDWMSKRALKHGRLKKMKDCLIVPGVCELFAIGSTSMERLQNVYKYLLEEKLLVHESIA